MKRDEAIRKELKRRGVQRLCIFGSTARDEAGPGSDVDVLVEVDHTNHQFGLFQQIESQGYLEETLGRTVDLATPGSLGSQMRDRILEERIFVA